jgi:RNA recognition motif-containing protein
MSKVDFASMPVQDDTWIAVRQLEAAFEEMRFGVENQLNVIEADTENLESMYDDLRGQVMSAEFVNGADGMGMRSLLVCYFPREANKEMIRQAFSPYGAIDSVYLVHKDGKPACYGFVNFHDHASAGRALAAANAERVELVDKRNVIWHVKAEWTLSTDIPKKPKKKRGKKKDEGVHKSEESPTPPVALNRAMKGYHPKMTLSGLPQHARIAHSLSYTVPTVS